MHPVFGFWAEIVPFLVVTAVLAGAMLPLQAVFNARLGQSVGSVFWAAGFSAALSSVLLCGAGLVSTGSAPRTNDLAALPFWAWIGGICGVVTLAGVTVAAPRIGAGGTIALVVAGQVIFSLALDHFGFSGLVPQPLNLQRALAASLLLSGALPVR